MSQLKQQICRIYFLVAINTPIDANINPIKSIVVKSSFKNSQAIEAVTIGIKKKRDIVLLAEFFFIKNIKIENAPKETKKTW